MYLGIVGALLLTLVTGFLAGKEYDAFCKLRDENRRRRRDEIALAKEADRARRRAVEAQRKYDYMFNVTWNGPRGK